MKILKNGLKPLEKFHLEPGFFPVSTRDVIPKTTLLENGILALGERHSRGIFSNKKILNLGMINPKSVSLILPKLENLKDYDAIQLFRIETNEYLEIMREIYGISLDEIASGTLRVYDEILIFLRKMQNKETTS